PRRESLRESHARFRLHTADQRPAQPFRTQANSCRSEATQCAGVQQIRGETPTHAQPVLRQLRCVPDECPGDHRQTSTNLLEAARLRACASRRLNHPGVKRAIHLQPIRSSRSLEQRGFRTEREQPLLCGFRIYIRYKLPAEAAKKLLSNRL